MLNLMIGLLTLLSVMLIVYHHLGYPLLLRLLGKRRYTDDQTMEPALPDAALPTITLIMPAYNEAAFIADKIRNLSILDYPRERLHVVIASDGSTDHTYQVALDTLREPECRDLSARVICFASNLGKVGVLNRLIDSVDSDIVALSDVSAIISMDALRLAAARFDDPETGVVNGRYRLLHPGSEGEKRYWEYQSRLKAAEAQLGSVIGAHGAFYLIRRHLYQPLPADTINDDFIIPMQIVGQGYRSVYEPDICALELEQASDAQDGHRRQRIAAGNLQQAIRLRQLLRPRFRGTAFTFASGKVLRVLMPFLMILALGGSLWLADGHVLFLLLAIGQSAVYLAWLVLEVLRTGDSIALLQTLKYLLRGHFNNLRGALRYLRDSLIRYHRQKMAGHH